MLGLAMTLTIQRVGLLDLSSMIEWTSAVTSDPSTVTVVFWPRCWSYRQRLATFGSVVSNVCIQTKPLHAKRFRDDPVGALVRKFRQSARIIGSLINLLGH
jgi:hypothetical protein